MILHWYHNGITARRQVRCENGAAFECKFVLGCLTFITTNSRHIVYKRWTTLFNQSGSSSAARATTTTTRGTRSTSVAGRTSRARSSTRRSDDGIFSTTTQTPYSLLKIIHPQRWELEPAGFQASGVRGDPPPRRDRAFRREAWPQCIKRGEASVVTKALPGARALGWGASKPSASLKGINCSKLHRTQASGWWWSARARRR
jgi:hypothetical protein